MDIPLGVFGARLAGQAGGSRPDDDVRVGTVVKALMGLFRQLVCLRHYDERGRPETIIAWLAFLLDSIRDIAGA
jgi:hypothetical protein